MSTTANVLSFEQWLLVEYDLYMDDHKRLDNRTKLEMRKEYEEYVKEASVSG